MFKQHKLPTLRLEDNAKIMTREVGEG